MASLRAVAVMACGLPMRAAKRRQNAPRAVSVRPRLITVIRRMAAALLAEGLRTRTEKTTTGELVLWSQRQPGREVLLGGPAHHVNANFRDKLEGGIGRNSIDLREVDTAGEVMQWGADLEARFVVARLPGDP